MKKIIIQKATKNDIPEIISLMKEQHKEGLVCRICGEDHKIGQVFCVCSCHGGYD